MRILNRAAPSTLTLTVYIAFGSSTFSVLITTSLISRHQPVCYNLQRSRFHSASSGTTSTLADLPFYYVFPARHLPLLPPSAPRDPTPSLGLRSRKPRRTLSSPSINPPLPRPLPSSKLHPLPLNPATHPTPSPHISSRPPGCTGNLHTHPGNHRIRQKH